MAQSVKLGDMVMDLVRRESALQSRSVAGQITHWLRIGRAIEQSGKFDYARISAALTGRLLPEDLTTEEHEVWAGAFMEQLAEPGPDEQAFFDNRQRLGQGVGLTDGGALIHASDEAKVA